MNDLDQRLRNVLNELGRLDPDKAHQLQQELADAYQVEYDRKLAQARLFFWLFMAFSVFLMVGGCAMLGTQPGVRGMLAGVVLILAGFEMEVLVKLWYWVVHGRLQIQRDLKSVELRVTELTGAVQAMRAGPPPAQT